MGADKAESNATDFLKSALTHENPLSKRRRFLSWIAQQRSQVDVKVERIEFEQLQDWRIDQTTGILTHERGAFFTVPGIEVTTSWGDIKCWSQPIIKQAEVGYLGFIVKEINGTLYFLTQAKIEPGNINKVQLSPTLQATGATTPRRTEGRLQRISTTSATPSPKTFLSTSYNQNRERDF